MKKIFLFVIIIFIVIVVALNFFPGAAKITETDASPAESMGEILVNKIPAPISIPVATGTVPVKNTPTAKELVAPKSVTAKKTTTTAKTTSSVSGNGVSWAASGLSAIGSLPSFDYSTKIRNAYKKKVVAYAKSKGIKLITASVVNSMRQ
jgi:hypothetical protein